MKKPDKLIFNGSDSQDILLVPELSCLVEKNSTLRLVRRNKGMPSSCQAAKVLKLLKFQYVDSSNEKLARYALILERYVNRVLDAIAFCTLG